MPNRQQRRHNAKIERQFSSLIKNGITQEDLRAKYMQGMKDGFEQGIRNCVKSCYASMILALTEKFGFDHDKCYEAIVAADEHVLYCIEYQEFADEVFAKTGLQLNFEEAIDRIERVEES